MTPADPNSQPRISNLSTIYSTLTIVTGWLHIPNNSVSLTAYVFNDSDLADNLFRLAALINLDYTATYSQLSDRHLYQRAFTFTIIYFTLYYTIPIANS